MAGKPLCYAQHFEHLPCCAGDRRGAAVEPRRDRARRVGGVDDLDRQAVVGKGEGQRLADEAATRNQDIAAQRFTHADALACGRTVGKAAVAAAARLTASPPHAHIAVVN